MNNDVTPRTVGLAHSILCATNDADAADFYRGALAEYEVTLSETGRDSLGKVNAQAFDAYVLDFWFADWNGVGLCRAIRDLDPHVPILFCSAPVAPAQKARALRAGASGYVFRPVESDALRSRIHALITQTDVTSLNARVEEERAIQDELDRRLASVQIRVESANKLLASSLERTARTKALRAFFDARGTRSHFERWWPQVFSSTLANHP